VKGLGIEETIKDLWMFFPFYLLDVCQVSS
jgi:hypothetical protein